uniref:acid phosphatase n=1 Tax=Panagrolaimus davidi TaxID=227884 RepID=A0A914QHD4_9BILA
MLIYFIFTIFFVTYVISENKLIHVHAKGINQFFTLGQKFQARYIDDFQLLSSDYVPSEVYARSTDIDRTIISAMTFYSGLYSDDLSSTDHILAPVPIHTIPNEHDFLFLLRFKCKRLDELQKITDNSKHIETLLKKHHSLLSEVSIKTQIPISYYQAIYVFDTATIEKSYGLPIPSWITSEKSVEFDQLFVDYVLTQYGFINLKNEPYQLNLQFELAKISCGALIAEIVDRLVLKIECLKNDTIECEPIKDQKLYTYSGHDITVVELFGGLGFKTFAFEKQTLPSFGATIILELWEDEGIINAVETENNRFEYYYVKIYYYQNSSVENPKYIGDLLQECQGQKGCPISYLIKRAELLRPKPDLKIS